MRKSLTFSFSLVVALFTLAQLFLSAWIVMLGVGAAHAGNSAIPVIGFGPTALILCGLWWLLSSSRSE